VSRVNEASSQKVIKAEVPVSGEVFCRHDGVQYSGFRTQDLSQEDPFKVIPKRKDHDAH
jgi:hypothetical protein